MSGCVSERAICRRKAYGLTQMDTRAHFLLPSHAGFFIWSNSTVFLTLHLQAHPSPTQRPGREVGNDECVFSLSSVGGNSEDE